MPSVTLLTHTPNPEKIVAAAAKLCYSAADIADLLDGLTDEKTAVFLERLMGLGHHSPLEHAVFTFGIEEVSRALLAQITRHRIASFSVQSQRYVGLEDFGYVTPPSIAEDAVARAAFEQSMEAAGAAYNNLAEALYTRYKAQLETKGAASADKLAAAKKQAIEDARFALPNACETKMVLTMNARALRGFFAQRCCERAQWEIRALAEEMLSLCKEASPQLFAGAGPPCLSAPCPEGKMSCGRPRASR
ncbi:MAG: FAD-dependent thymidylate synthase [Oscillospiraceae bacterium]|nr:FAD-dependent thymidylate synthase [Oscillospiraceae bacterium]